MALNNGNCLINNGQAQVLHNVHLPTSVLKQGSRPPSRSPGNVKHAAKPAYSLDLLRQQYAETVVKDESRLRFTEDKTWAPSTSGRYMPVALRCNAQLDKDIMLVALEAGLSPAAAGAILVAAQKATISANPGVLLSQIVGLLPLSELLGRRTLLLALTALPSLLNYSADTLRFNLENLASLVPPDKLPRLVRGSPALLVRSPFTVWGNLQALMELLQLSDDEVAVLVLRQPRLLTYATSEVRARCLDLGGLMDATPAQVSQLVRRQPALLTYYSHTLAANLEALAALVLHDDSSPCGGGSCDGSDEGDDEYDDEDAAAEALLAAVRRQPSLLMLRPAGARDRWLALREVVARGGAARPAAVLRRVVLRQPALLTLSPANLAGKLDVLTALMEGDAARAVELARLQPSLLTQSSATLLSKWRALHHAAALSPSWTAQLQAASLQTLGLWLCLAARRYQRLHALAAAGAASEPPPLNLARLLTMSDDSWAKALQQLHTATNRPHA